MKDLFDALLPRFGQKALVGPVWNEGMCMFISDEYESEAGNRYFKGIRFSNRMAIVETVGLYHTWTYIDGVEVYIFDDKKPKCVGKKMFDKVYYDSELVRNTAKDLMLGYIKAQLRLSGCNEIAVDIDAKADRILDECYVSVNSEDYKICTMRHILPLLMKDAQNLIENC